MSAVLDEVTLERVPDIAALLDESVRLERPQPVVLALDIGIDRVASALFDSRGNEIVGSHVSLSDEFADSAHESDADVQIEFIMRAIDVATARAESFISRIDYVALSCVWRSLLGIDEHGRAVTPLLDRAGTRATSTIAELRSKFDEDKTHARTGAPFQPSYWPAKLVWLKDERTEVFNRARWWLSVCDYLFLRLFGADSTSVSMASGTGLFNQKECDWDRELCEGLGVSLRNLPDIAQAGETHKLSSVDHVARWPLLEGATWFPAIGDRAADNIGMGCVTSERAALTIGSSTGMHVLFSGASPATLPPELFCHRADRDRVVIGGRIIGEVALGQNDSMEVTGYRLVSLAGALDGLAPNATIVAAGEPLVSSPAAAQMLADILGKPIELSSASDASLRGAALLALEAIGKIDSIETLESPRGKVYEPDLARHEIYARAFERR